MSNLSRYITVLFRDNRRPFAILQNQNKLQKSKQKVILSKCEFQNSSWSGNSNVKFWKFEDEQKSFCMASILTSKLMLKILVPSIQMIILPSKYSIQFFPSWQSPRLGDFFSNFKMKRLKLSNSVFVSCWSNDGLLTQKRCKYEMRLM